MSDNENKPMIAVREAIELIQCFEAVLSNMETAHSYPVERVKRQLRDVYESELQSVDTFGNKTTQDELQSLRQRNEELEHCIENRAKQWAEQHIKISDLEKSLITEAVNKQEFKDLQNQILSQQLTIEKMRDLLEEAKRCVAHANKAILGKEYTNANGAVCLAILHLDESLSLQPSTAELAKHDESVRVEEREACANVAEQGRFLHENAPDALFGKACAKAIRQRKTS